MDLGVEPDLSPAAAVPWTPGMDRQTSCVVSGGESGWHRLLCTWFCTSRRKTGYSPWGNWNFWVWKLKKKSYLFNENTLLMGRWDINFIVGVHKGSRETTGKCGRIQWLRLWCRWRDRVKSSDQSWSGRQQEKKTVTGTDGDSSQQWTAEWRSRRATPSGPCSKDHPLLKGDGMGTDEFKDEYRHGNVHVHMHAWQN